MLPLAPALAADGQSQRRRAPPERADSDIAPFSSHYVAEWKDISVGVSDLELRRDTEPGHYVYKWTIQRAGIFRLVYSDDLVQESWFDRGRPSRPARRYRGQQGSASVNFDFDWNCGACHRDLRRQAGRSHPQAGYTGSQFHPDPGHARLEEWQSASHVPRHRQGSDQGFLYAREGTASSRRRSERSTPSSSPAATRQRPACAAHVVRARLGCVPVQAERTKRRQARVRDAHQEPDTRRRAAERAALTRRAPHERLRSSAR